MTQDNAGAVEQRRPYETMMQELIELAEVEGGDSFSIAARVTDEIATATTIDEVFAANEQGPKDAEDFLNTPLGVIGVRWWKSAEQFRQGTLGVYAVIDYQDTEGKTDMISIGAPNVVASLRQLQLLGEIGEGRNPLWVQIKSRQTPNGNLYTLHAATPPPF